MFQVNLICIWRPWKIRSALVKGVCGDYKMEERAPISVYIGWPYPGYGGLTSTPVKSISHATRIEMHSKVRIEGMSSSRHHFMNHSTSDTAG